VGIFILDDIYNKTIFMNKKLIITEEQYYKLKLRLLETKFNILADKVIRNGDILTILSDGNKLSFKVIDSYGGQIYMDNIDNGSEYYGKRVFLTNTSFDDVTNLTINVANNDEQKNQKPLKGDTWPKMVLKKVEDIYIHRNGKFIDAVNFDAEKAKEDEKAKEKNSEKKNGFLETLGSLNDGETLILEPISREKIELVFLEKENKKIKFNISKKSKEELNLNSINLVEIETDKIDIDDKNDALIVTLLAHIDVKGDEEEDTVDYTDIEPNTIKVVDWEIGTKSPDEEKQEEKPEEEEESISQQQIFDILTGDTQLKSILFSKGNKTKIGGWLSSFANEFSDGKEIENDKGWIVLKKFLDDYLTKKVSDKFGASFKKNGAIHFQPLDNVQIPYTDKKGVKKYFVLEANKIYRDEMAVKFKNYDDEDLSSSDYNLVLSNKNNFEIEVVEKTEKPNIYLCNVVKLYKNKSEENGEKVTERTEPVEVNIRFLDSLGYTSQKQQKQEQK